MTQSQDKPLLGFTLMLAFCLLIPMADALAKLLGPHLSVGQMVTLRFLFQAGLLIPVCLILGKPFRMRRIDLIFVAIRAMLHITGIALMVTALLYLPIADAVAIAFVMPFIMLLLGHFILHEEVGWRRLIACAVGFVGTLLVIQPAFQDVGWPALFPLGVAFVFAAYMLVSRQIGSTVDPIGGQAVSALIGLTVLIPASLFLPGPSFTWAPIGQGLWLMVIGMGIAGTLGHLLMAWALKYAPASTLAPMQYLEIPIATLVGYLVFNDLPGPLASLGIAITIASGLYVIQREHATQKRAASPE
jgi:drug/metabolite transporter (DMT)-like permease